jgi:hypothetical protein
MATTNSSKWYRVSVTDLIDDHKKFLIGKGWVQSEKYPAQGLYMRGNGEGTTKTLEYESAIKLPAKDATMTDVNELDSLFAGMNVGGRRKSKKARKSRKSRKTKSRKTKSRKSKSHKK